MLQTRKTLFASSALVIGTVLACAGYWINLSHNQDAQLSHARDELALEAVRLSVAADTQVDAMLRSLDLAAQQLRVQYQSRDPDFLANVKRTLAVYPPGMVEYVVITDREGKIVFNSLEPILKTQVSVADREYFRTLATSDLDRPFVAPPVQGRISRTDVIHITRPLIRNGHFDGVIALPVRPAYIAQALNSLQISARDSIALIRNDGTFIAHSDLEQALGSLKGVPAGVLLNADPGASGAHHQAGDANRQTLTYGWHRMSNWPLLVLVGLDEDDQLAGLVAQQHDLRTTALLSMTVITVLVLGISFLLLRLARRNLILIREEKQLRQMFESNAAIKLILNPADARIEDANPAAAEYFGYPLSQLLSMRYSQLNCMSENRTLEELSAARQGRQDYFRFSNRLASGEIRQVEVYTGPLDTAAGSRLYLIIHDITDRYQAIEALKESGGFREALLDSAAYALIGTDLEGVITVFNRGAENLLGYSGREVIGLQTPDLFHDEAELVRRSLQGSSNLGKELAQDFSKTIMGPQHRGMPGSGEWTFVRKDGQRLTVHLAVSVIHDERSNVAGYLGIVQDISARKQAENELRRSEERLTLVLKGAGLGLWDWNIRTGKVTHNPRWAEIMGDTLDNLNGTVSEWETRLHPEDMPRAKEALNRLLKGESNEYRATYRLEHRDGHWVWVVDAGQITERDALGQPIRATGVILDISDTKNAEEALKVREERLRTLISAMDDLVFLVDTSGRINEIHWPTPPAGQSWPDSSDWINRAYDELLPGNISEEVAEAIVSLMLDGQPLRKEFSWRLGKEERHFLATFSALTNGRPWPSGFLCVARDVTDLKNMENRLRQQALSDPLTGVGNRRQFYELMNAELSKVRRFGSPATILMLDLDHFKSINDTYGHGGGDLVLQHFCQLIQNRLRASDYLGRLGGEEFGILLSGTGEEGAHIFAESLRRRVAESEVAIDGKPVKITVSIGISALHSRDSVSDDAIARADGALYAAKFNGRNRVERFTAQTPLLSH